MLHVNVILSVCMLKTKNSSVVNTFCSFPSPLFVCLSAPSGSSGVRREEPRSGGESRGHRGKASVRLLTGRKERERETEQKN